MELILQRLLAQWSKYCRGYWPNGVNIAEVIGQMELLFAEVIGQMELILQRLLAQGS